ncbi:MAG: hypothetical protein V8R48_01520 [Eggerthella lenta]
MAQEAQRVGAATSRSALLRMPSEFLNATSSSLGLLLCIVEPRRLCARSCGLSTR